MLTLSYIKEFAFAHADIAYLLIVLGVIIEGEIVVVIAGIFAHLGSINIFYAFLATIFGGSIKSVLGYGIGYYLQKNHSHRPIVHQSERRVNYFLPNFCERPFWSIFLSRFLILGIHWFGLIFTGYKRIKIRTFIKAESSSLIVWAIAMLSIGYFFSYTALSVSRDVRKFLGILLLFFIAFFIVEKIVAFIIELWENKDSKTTQK
jgi:membrane protein DedA with SNARE-associated domain